jgi:hypothetical protein
VKARATAKEIVRAKNRSKERGQREAGPGLSRRERRAKVARAWTHQTTLAPAGESRLFPG